MPSIEWVGVHVGLLDSKGSRIFYPGIILRPRSFRPEADLGQKDRKARLGNGPGLGSLKSAEGKADGLSPEGWTARGEIGDQTPAAGPPG